MNCGESFTTTNDAESPINILQHNTYDTISCYVIFNQVGNYTIILNRSIEGTSRQKVLLKISVLQHLVRHLHDYNRKLDYSQYILIYNLN